MQGQDPFVYDKHRGREGKCGAECETVHVVLVLWECPAYSLCREGFGAKFKELIGDSFEQFRDRATTAMFYVVSSGGKENLEDMLRQVKELIVWEEETLGKGYSSVRPWLEMQGLSVGGGLRVSKMGKLQDRGKLGMFHVCSDNVHASDCRPTHCCGCIVNGISAKTTC